MQFLRAGGGGGGGGIGEVTLQAGGRIHDTSNSRKIHFDRGFAS